ncbi:MAG: acyl carrier protein [Thermoguttaceae bacterium]|jgi:acyl carrier protein
MAMRERLANIFHKAFGLEINSFSPNIAPEDVPNWDSIGHMNLVMYLEQEFNQRFEVDEIMEMSSPAKIMEILAAKGVAD